MNYVRAIGTEIYAQIMVRGILKDWFTGKKFNSYLRANGLAPLGPSSPRRSASPLGSTVRRKSRGSR